MCSKDMKKFGGPGKFKQKCIQRCVLVSYRPPELEVDMSDYVHNR